MEDQTAVIETAFNEGGEEALEAFTDILRTLEEDGETEAYRAGFTLGFLEMMEIIKKEMVLYEAPTSIN